MTQPDNESISLSPALDALIRQIPKVELHVHLEGSIVPELALRLAARRNVRLPGADQGVDGLRRAYRFRDFRSFIEVYLALSSTLQQAEDFADAVFGVAEQLAAQQVRWAEMTFTPMTHVTRGAPRGGARRPSANALPSPLQSTRRRPSPATTVQGA